MENKSRFVIILINEKIRIYRKLGLVFAVISVFPFLVFSFYEGFRWVGILGIGVFVLYFLIKKIFGKRLQDKSQIDENIFFLLASVWLLKSVVMAILILIIGILFKFALQPFRFVFTKEEVLKDFFPKKKYEWKYIDNVVLKADMLTINFKDDRLIQGLIENGYETDELEFNHFIREQLNNS